MCKVGWAVPKIVEIIKFSVAFLTNKGFPRIEMFNGASKNG